MALDVGLTLQVVHFAANDGVMIVVSIAIFLLTRERYYEAVVARSTQRVPFKDTLYRTLKNRPFRQMLGTMATFITYALDKRAALRGGWRVAENTLHGLALLCGWPGALLAQELLRHKSAKREFRRLFWLTVALNVLGFALLFTPLREWATQRLF